MSIARLFVYGTLRPGHPNAYLLERIGGTWQKAHVLGHLDDQGWGLTGGYPAIKLDPNGPQVEGYIFSSSALKQNWPRLDEFEGDAYARVSTEAVLTSGKTVRVYIYQLAGTIR